MAHRSYVSSTKERPFQQDDSLIAEAPVKYIWVGTVKPVSSSHSKRSPKIGFQYRLWLNAGQKYCRKLHREHSAILSTFIMLPFSIKTFVCLFLSSRLRQVLLNNVWVGTCVQYRFKSVCATAQSDQSLSFLPEETLDPWLPIQCW